MRFEWNERKQQLNEKKHGISFATAALVFNDPDIISILDCRFLYEEERWYSLGLVGDTVLYVAHTIGENEYDQEVFRIISARIATASEQEHYFAELCDEERIRES